MKQETKTKLCWYAVAACCGFLALANLMLPLSTVHSRSRTNKRIADLEALEVNTVSAQELREALVDVQHISQASHRLLNINVYVPAIIFIIALVGAQCTSQRKERIAEQNSGAYRRKTAESSE